MKALYTLLHKYRASASMHQSGGALLLVIMLLMALALSALAVSGQQTLLLTRHYVLDVAYLKQREEIEAAFEHLATTQITPSILSQGIGYDASSSPSTEIQSSVNPVPCPEENVAGACFSAFVQYDKGPVRERLLVVPEPACGRAYWYSPANRILPREGTSYPEINNKD